VDMTRGKKKMMNGQKVVTQRFVGVAVLGVYNFNVAVNSLIDLSPTSTGLGSLSSQITNFCDMYREVRLDKLKIAFSKAYALSAGITMPLSVFCITQTGTVAPTWSTIETPLISNFVDGHVFATAAGIFNPTTDAVMKCRGSDLVVLNEASGPGEAGWIATSGDGSTTSWGTVYKVQATAGTACTYSIGFRYDITLSFRVLVDPAQISSAKLAARVQRELLLLEQAKTKTTDSVDGSTTEGTPGAVALVETAPIKTVAAELTGNSGTAVAAWQTKPLGEYENPVIGTNDDLIAYRAFLELRRRKG